MTVLRTIIRALFKHPKTLHDYLPPQNTLRDTLFFADEGGVYGLSNVIVSISSIFRVYPGRHTKAIPLKSEKF